MGVDTWNAEPAATEGGGWKPDEPAITNGGGWQADNVGGDGFGGGEDGFAQDNVSKHAHDSGCRICGDEAHFARDCPQKGEGGGGMTGECYNCGEVGHNKAECTNPRVEREFTGMCRTCEQTGHRAADCPDKPPATCNLCKASGHIASECTVNRLIFAVKEMSVDDAWGAVERADKERDVDDIKEAILTYAKAYPDLSFEELDSVFREASMNTYLIAKEQEVSDTHTIVNLQGKIDMKYAVSIQFSDKPRRAAFAQGWPKSKEENIERLAEAGFILDRMVQKCSNCGALGHGSKKCPEERQEPEKVVISCANCNEEGHRARDCTQPRKEPRGPKACKNCGSTEHIAKECPEPPNPENVECRNCGETGHFSKDCPTREPDVCRNCWQEGHRAKDCEKEKVMKCRNCDELGHVSRECTKPKDWSRVKCTNCEQMGHGAKRCTETLKEVEEGEAGGDGGW